MPCLDKASFAFVGLHGENAGRSSIARAFFLIFAIRICSWRDFSNTRVLLGECCERGDGVTSGRTELVSHSFWFRFGCGVAIDRCCCAVSLPTSCSTNQLRSRFWGMGISPTVVLSVDSTLSVTGRCKVTVFLSISSHDNSPLCSLPQFSEWICIRRLFNTCLP